MRLNKIIAVCVSFRLPLFLVKMLVHLPLQSVYSLVNVAFKGYSGSKLYPYSLSIKETVSTVIDVLRMGRSNIDKRLGKSLNEFLLVEKLNQEKNSANQKLGELF